MFHYFAIRSDQLPYLVPYFLSAALMLAMLAYLWRQRANPLARYYGWVIVAQFVSTVAYVLEIAADELAIKAFWVEHRFFALSITPIFGRDESLLDAETEIPKAKEKGFIGFISKPINLLQFPKQIAACIEGQEVWVTSHSR